MSEADAKFQVVRTLACRGRAATHVTLYQAVLKGDHFAWALQKGVEVGVSRFVPMVCERNVIDDLDAVEDKRERWERIIQEAAEQSGRGRLPELAPAELFGQAVAQRPDLAARMPTAGERALVRLIPWEGEHDCGCATRWPAVTWPQGRASKCLSGRKAASPTRRSTMARRYGIRPVTLGPRILRAETAGVVAAALDLVRSGRY